MILSPSLYRSMFTRGYKSYLADSIRLDSLIGLMNIDPMELSINPASENKMDSIFGFDPNRVTYQQLMLLGFDTLMAKRIVKYRNRGGRFVTKEDLLKIYGLPDSMYQRLRNHILLPDRIVIAHTTFNADCVNMYDAIAWGGHTFYKGSEAHKKVLLNINLADSSDFMKIRGIGPVLSKRIIKYRELLGGYSNIGQLDSVYGLKGEALQFLKSVAGIDSMFKPKTIRVNYSSWKELVRHPYINSQLANDIIKLRSEKGYLKDEHDLKYIPYLGDSLLIRLRPYLEF